MNYTLEELDAMDLEDSKREIEQSVYESTVLIEQLQIRGKLRGNGHHARQKIARMVSEELESRWISDKVR